MIMKIWKNIVWFFTEIMNLWSDKPSFFSKKRVESSIAFIIAQVGMITYLFTRIGTMDIYELLMWAGAEFLIAGYSISQIKEKKRTTLFAQKIHLGKISIFTL